MLICPTDVTAGRHSLTSDGSAERPLIGSGVSPHVCDITAMEHGMVKTSRQWNKRFADARWRSLQKRHIVRRCSLKKCEMRMWHSLLALFVRFGYSAISVGG
jgi:hypothetical protein